MMIRSASLVVLMALILSGHAYAGPRSYAAKSEFKRINPCPATEKHRGPCPGWQIDHIVQLKCGGEDIPSNMQWLTVDDHKEKTRRESSHCQRRKKGESP